MTIEVAPPLTETTFASRVLHANPASVISSDGLWLFSMKFMQTMNFTDGNGVPVVIEFKDKT